MEEPTKDYERSEKERRTQKICESESFYLEGERLEEHGASQTHRDREPEIFILERY
jgi:hypothetical protein